MHLFQMSLHILLSITSHHPDARASPVHKVVGGRETLLNRERRTEGLDWRGEGVCPAAAVGAASGERNPMPAEGARAVQVSCEPVVLCVARLSLESRAAAKKEGEKRGEDTSSSTNVFACNVRVAVGRAAGR